jgi:hypothetical protein
MEDKAILRGISLEGRDLLSSLLLAIIILTTTEAHSSRLQFHQMIATISLQDIINRDKSRRM